MFFLICIIIKINVLLMNKQTMKFGMTYEDAFGTFKYASLFGLFFFLPSSNANIDSPPEH